MQQLQSLHVSARLGIVIAVLVAERTAAYRPVSHHIHDLLRHHATFASCAAAQVNGKVLMSAVVP